MSPDHCFIHVMFSYVQMHSFHSMFDWFSEIEVFLLPVFFIFMICRS